MHTILIVVLLACFGVTAGAAPLILSDAERRHVQQLGIVNFCVDPDWSPFEVVDNNSQYVGIGADLLALVSQRTGLTLHLFKTKDWPESLEASKAGRCRLLSLLNQTPLRDAWLIFTEPILTDDNVIITREEHPFVVDLASLPDQTMALPKGTSIEERARRDFPNIKIVLTDTETEALQMVSDRKADMTMRALIVAAYTIKHEGWFNLKIAGQVPGYRNQLRIGVLKDDSMLRDILNKGVASITPFERQQIVERYITINATTGIDYAMVRQLLIVIILILVTSLYWLRKTNLAKRLTEQTAQGLKESNDRTVALFNATNDAVIMLDAHGPFDCNIQAVKMFGASSKEQFLSLPPWSPQITVAIQAGGIAAEVYQRQCVEAAIRNGTNRGELVHKRLDNGEEFEVDIVLTAIQLNGETVLQAVLRDISEHIRAERKLQVANEELARINEDKDRFMSMLSHELKTPLAVIRMSLGAALDVIDESSRSRLIRAIADMNAIVERCLQSDRLDHGRIEVEKEVCNPGDILRNAVDASNEPERVQIKTAPLREVVTDKQLLGVILSNLIDNALKYGNPTSPIIIATEQSERGGKDGLTLVVLNQVGSSGMPDPQQIFRRYYRAAEAHAKTGSGLGMYIASGIARMLGGELSYRSQDNTVKFELWIPN